MNVKKYGTTSTKLDSQKEWDSILNEFRKYGSPTFSRGFSSYHKLTLSRKDTLSFIQYSKEIGFVKIVVVKEETGKEYIKYSKVLQSSTKRLNFDYCCYITKDYQSEKYKVGVAFKSIYPKSMTKTLTAAHTPRHFIW